MTTLQDLKKLCIAHSAPDVIDPGIHPVFVLKLIQVIEMQTEALEKLAQPSVNRVDFIIAEQALSCAKEVLGG